MATAIPGSPRTRLAWRPILVCMVMALTAIATALYWMNHPSALQLTSQAAEAPPTELPPSGVGALGRLEPGWKVFQVSPSSGADGTRVDMLLVEEGEEVQANEVLAILDTYARRKAAVEEAEAHVAVSRSRLELVKVGAKTAEIAAQESLIPKYLASVEHARLSLNRAERLRQKNAVTEEDYESRKLEYESNLALLEQARNTLKALQTVRPEDIAISEAELQKAMASLSRAKAELDAAQILAPISGRVLKIHSRQGERVGEQGLADLGDTNQMHAVAEVYESDAARVKVGSSARVKVQSLPGELTGEVVRVGWLIGRQEVFNNDPVRDTDARIVEVRIQLDAESGAKVASLSYARVEVTIDTKERH